jgi:aminopeptidase-like protein
LAELKEHLFTLLDHPDWTPYKTSYYKEDWGFCIPHSQYLKLEEGDYEVFIDSTLKKGHLTYGELFLQGEQREEVLISTHACHPSLCNDNLSAISVATFLAKNLSRAKRRYSYRFLFIPGTIGAITWLKRNFSHVRQIKHGLVLTGVGDSGGITYKKSRCGDTEIDRAVIHVLKHSGDNYRVIDFEPYGYDERQYCSPGFNLPVGRLSRTPYGEYPEYHTSADNLDFVNAKSLSDTLSKLLNIFDLLESNRTYLSLNMMCEPQLGKRGLYNEDGEARMAMLWMMNLCDGNNSLLDIAERSNMKFSSVTKAANELLQNNLLIGRNDLKDNTRQYRKKARK